MTRPSDAFLEVMRQEAGWVEVGHLSRCQRCGARFPELFLVEWDVPVHLLLCAVCQRLVWAEVWHQRRPALMRVYRIALAAARIAAAGRDAPEVSERRDAEPV